MKGCIAEALFSVLVMTIGLTLIGAGLGIGVGCQIR